MKIGSRVIIVAIIILLLLAGTYYRFLSLIPETRNKGIAAVEIAIPLQETKFHQRGEEIIVLVPPDRHISVPLPFNHIFDFYFEDDFEVKLMNGRLFKFTKELYPYVGTIPGNRIKLRSLTGEEVKITIFLSPDE